MEVLMYRPICVEITGRTWKHFCTTYELREYREALLYYVAIVCVEIAGRTENHFCTTHELQEYGETLLYYVALCMRRMWEYREALLYYTYFCNTPFPGDFVFLLSIGDILSSYHKGQKKKLSTNRDPQSFGSPRDSQQSFGSLPHYTVV
ncbi:hypothetical protein F2Q69_00060620 [Brassica cretica]|uniref:Uncharacterized protein n=1 Tax=Brassica cretica TaxID=69181 RepID=A0A8S9RAL6_BRACR|nr:hypothetical protein F2Q69_00060620 [Brassica cretica]